MSERQRDETARRRTELFRRRGTTATPAPVTAGMHLTRYIADGRIVGSPTDATAADALKFAQEGRDHLAMTLYPSPTPPDVEELASAWALHPLLVEDLVQAHQRPKLERYGEVLFLVVRSARYLDAAEEVDFSEFHLLVRPHALAVLCQDRRWIDGTDEAGFAAAAVEGRAYGGWGLLDNEKLLRLGPEAVVYAVLDAIVDGYFPVLQGLEIDKEQIERQVFSGETGVAERIYRLSQEVIDLQHASSSLAGVLDALRGGFGKYEVPDELQAYLQDVSDHLTQVGTRVTELRDALSQILNVNATLVAQRQNEDMKKISGWAAILFAPTLIAAIYGMNFDRMPELHWAFGYPLAVAGMILFAAILYVIFKVKKWM